MLKERMYKLIIHSKGGDVQIALVKNEELVNFNIETNRITVTKDNIYLGKITRIERSLNAVFVNYGEERDGFLPFKEIHLDYLKDPNSLSQLQEGQMILVQVVKDQRETKGAYLTTYIHLIGCYIVLFPNRDKKHGISHSIDDKSRDFLKNILNKVNIKGGHVIFRTASGSQDENAIINDLNSLMNLWQSIKKEGARLTQTKKISLLYRENDIAFIIIKEYIREDISLIAVDNKKLFHHIKEKCSIFLPSYLEKIHYHNHITCGSIFLFYKIQNEVKNLFSREIMLTSGGSIILEQTEALMAIDVNSKHSNKLKNLEDTAFSTNAEAVKEIVKQIILRNISGIIVIDFIDMLDKDNKLKIEEMFFDLSRRDKVLMKITRISKLGLMEISRQRTNLTITKVTSQDADLLHLKNSLQAHLKSTLAHNLFLVINPKACDIYGIEYIESILSLEKKFSKKVLIFYNSLIAEREFIITSSLDDTLIKNKQNNFQGLRESFLTRYFLAPLKRTFHHLFSKNNILKSLTVYKDRIQTDGLNRKLKVYQSPHLLEKIETVKDKKDNEVAGASQDNEVADVSQDIEDADDSQAIPSFKNANVVSESLSESLESKFNISKVKGKLKKDSKRLNRKLIQRIEEIDNDESIDLKCNPPVTNLELLNEELLNNRNDVLRDEQRLDDRDSKRIINRQLKHYDSKLLKTLLIKDNLKLINSRDINFKKSDLASLDLNDQSEIKEHKRDEEESIPLMHKYNYHASVDINNSGWKER